MKRVLFVCVHNSGRSQMAEAFANRLGQGKLIAQSAGTQPDESIDPVVAEAMREIGYDLSGRRPKPMSVEMVDSADRVITMGCGVDDGVCPAALVPTEDWELDDPKGQPIEKVRQIRDQIRHKVERLLEELGNG